MTQDFSKRPQPEVLDGEELQLTPDELRELERTERRNAMMQDSIQDLASGIEALASPLEADVIADAPASTPTTDATSTSAPTSAQAAGSHGSRGQGRAPAKAQSQAQAVDQNQAQAGIQAGAQAGGDEAQHEVPVADMPVAIDDVKVLSDEDLDHLEQLQQNFEGFRIQRVDVYNWSSFNNNVKTVFFGGQNVLMTGDNGAGKSSIIDAITVLLYDVQKIVFNQAAGAEKGERNLASYVWGLYKNDNSMGVKTEFGLRSEQKAVLSIIMATFYNQALDEYVVLVQCLSINKQKSNPDRYYYIGNRDFNLQTDVLPVKEVRELNKKLSALGCERFNSFREYSGHMQDLFGIRRTKVLDLFYKTISMKSISNISDFVRKQMLEDFSGDELVDDLIERVDDLNSAYNAVEEAKQQLEDLAPIVEKGEKYAGMGERIVFVNQCIDKVTPFMKQKQSELLRDQVQSRSERLAQLANERTSIEEKIETIENDLSVAKQELLSQGGDRQETLKQKIALEERDRQRIAANFMHHSQFMQNLGLQPVETEAAFNALPKKLESMKVELLKSQETFEANKTQASIELENSQAQEMALSQELNSLRERKNNIPLDHVRVREMICEAVGCAEEDLPFVGELIRIKDSEKEVWERSIEKVLHNYAISMLVTEDYYADVVHYVNTHNIGMRLVFYRIKERDLQASNANSLGSAFGSRMSNIQQVGANSLVRKLEFKQEPRFQAYLRQSLEKSFNYVCTTSEQEYRAERDALMPSGLSKKGGRNEKDDRQRARSNDYVLGWTNEEKIIALTHELSHLKVNMDALRNNIRSLRESLLAVQNKISCITRLREVNSFSQIDVRVYDERLEALRAELTELQRSSDIIAALSKRIDELENEKRMYRERLGSTQNEYGMIQGRLESMQREYENALEIAKLMDGTETEVFSELERCSIEAMRVLHFQNLDPTKTDAVDHEMAGRLRKRLSDLNAESSRLKEELAQLETAFVGRFPVVSRNLVASADAWIDFKTLHDKLQADDLPKYLDAFRHKLSTDTLDQFATLNAKFSSDRRAIEERIAQINEIMYEVDFNPNHYIRMVATDSKDLEIQQFRNDLKACTRGSLGGFELDEPDAQQNAGQNDGQNDGQTSGLNDGAKGQAGTGADAKNAHSALNFSNFDFEKAAEKFHQVKALIDRFKGVANGEEIDGKWRRKVTDVKQWFEFSASEHSREDDSMVDYYEDSSGKSGGQKEKLAYTVLASSLAYQYKSRQQRNQDRSFRFVIIDEAFGRGSPQSVDYALTLFNKFHLQLLVATPMQKLDIIEKFVSHVAFVYRNEITNESTVINYELQDYILKRKLKEQINQSRALGKLKEASIVVPSRKGEVAMNVAQVEKLVSDLDSRIRGEQDRYTGPSQGNHDSAQAKVQAQAQDASAGTETKKRLGVRRKKEEQAAQELAAELRAEALAKAQTQGQGQAQAQGQAQGQSQANNIGFSGFAAQQGMSEEAQLAQLQKSGSLMGLVSGSAQGAQVAKSAQGGLSDQGQRSQPGQAQGQVQGELSAAQIVAQTRNVLRQSKLTAEEIAAAQGLGMHTRNAQGQHMSIEEFNAQQSREHKEQERNELNQAFDKLNELENMDMPQHKAPEPDGMVLNFDAAPIDLRNLAKNAGIMPEKSKSSDQESDDKGGEVTVDTKLIQKENRELNNWLKRSVSQEAKNRYAAKPQEDEIKPSRSLDALFGVEKDDDSDN